MEEETNEKYPKRGLLFLVSIIVYIAVTIELHLYKYELIFLSYFLLPVIWALGFSENPFLGIRWLILSGIFNGINRILGKKIIPWTTRPRVTQFTFKDLLKAVSFIILFHFIFIFIIIKLSPASKTIDFTSTSLNITALLFDSFFWALLFFIRAIYLTLTEERS